MNYNRSAVGGEALTAPTVITLQIFMQIRYMAALATLVLLELFLSSGTSDAAVPQNHSLTVFVSILPEVDFVEKIGGNRVRVVPLVLPGQSPATYTPKPQQMATLAAATLYFRIGVPFENGLMPKIRRSMPKLNVVDLRVGIKLIDQGHGHHEGPDPHIWLDPTLVSRMAVTIRDALISIDPEAAESYRANCEKFQSDLLQLDQYLRRTLEPVAGQTMYVFHPAYTYFCHAYNLKQKAIIPEGKTPGALHLSRLVEEAGRDGVRYIFVQPQFSRKTAEAVAREIGAILVPLDPLAENYMENMRNMGNSIRKTLNP